ncbi:MAG TPA: hypothetical protein VF261_00940 [Candidatus Saccharimonadales bacterium]
MGETLRVTGFVASAFGFVAACCAGYNLTQSTQIAQDTCTYQYQLGPDCDSSALAVGERQTDLEWIGGGAVLLVLGATTVGEAGYNERRALRKQGWPCTDDWDTVIERALNSDDESQ